MYEKLVRLNNKQIEEISSNLIELANNKAEIKKDTTDFIANWVMSTHKEKNKSYYKVWEIVLKNYLPKSRPILFRATPRIYKNDRISSFTSSIYCAKKFSNKKGYIIICDTAESLELENRLYKKGNYHNSFYPLYEVLLKAKLEGGWGFSDYFFEKLGEKEYIMNTNFDEMYILKV